MQTSTKERTWKKATGNLPPLVILEVGDELKGEIVSVDTVTTTMKRKNKGKWIDEEKERTFYRIRLDEVAHVHGGKKGKDGYNPVTYERGQIVSLPEAGALDNTLAKIAREKQGIGDDEDVDLDTLKGVFVNIKRMPDDKMKKGQFAGNMVKTFDVDYSFE